MASSSPVLIEDILCLIFEELQNDSPALARSAQVCRTFANPALDVLWRNNLTRCLPLQTLLPPMVMTHLPHLMVLLLTYPTSLWKGPYIPMNGIDLTSTPNAFMRCIRIAATTLSGAKLGLASCPFLTFAILLWRVHHHDRRDSYCGDARYCRAEAFRLWVHISCL